jgi:nitrite reductase/ring-hydroxylating ferredoxin subunit
MWWWRKRQWIAVARVGELASGQLLAVRVAGEGGQVYELVLGRERDRYFAVQRQCVHQGADLAAGTILRGELVCPMHGWRFSTQTGKGGIGGACLTVHDVRVAGDRVEVDARPRKR